MKERTNKMGKCPHCNSHLKLEPYVFDNLDAYGGTKIAVTLCCNNPVTCSISHVYHTKVYTGDNTEDDWGVPFTTGDV